MSTPLDQIRQMSVAQQLAIVQQIWDGLRESPDLVQAWHVDEARRRTSELESNPSIAISEDEVWQQVNKLLG